MSAYVHPTAIVEDGVRLGAGTSVWDHAHLRRGASVGRDCIIGGKAYVAAAAVVGDRCKINSFAYVCTGVRLGDGVMVAAHATFTNDDTPRACVNDLSERRSSDVDEHTRPTAVGDGATIGANATIGNDLVVGRFAVVGMGSVVTRSVAPYTLVVGNPARPLALVCRCGRPIADLRRGPVADGPRPCPSCDVVYTVEGSAVVEDPYDADTAGRSVA